MRTNKLSRSRLKGIHVSSILKWAYQDNFKPVSFFFFLRKDFARTNTRHCIGKQYWKLWRENEIILNFSKSHVWKFLILEIAISQDWSMKLIFCMCIDIHRSNKLNLVWISSGHVWAWLGMPKAPQMIISNVLKMRYDK